MKDHISKEMFDEIMKTTKPQEYITSIYCKDCNKKMLADVDISGMAYVLACEMLEKAREEIKKCEKE